MTRLAITELSQFARNTGRFHEVVSTLARYGFVDWLQHAKVEWVRELLKGSEFHEIHELSSAARVRQATTELGTTFIKLGQVLSTRPDLVGNELANELAELRTGTPPDPPDTVRAILEKELGNPIEVLYADFEDQALASASIGQVHRATLHDGTPVVVKVQHPGIEDRIRNDLDILARLSELAEKYSAQLRQYRPVDIAADFSRTLLRELDFRSEQRNLERFRRNFEDEQGVRFPATYSQLSSRRVLTMDLLTGISMSDGTALRSANLDLEDLAKRGADLFVEMIFRDGFYHADPHPGNLMVLPRPASGEEPADATESTAIIGVLDCGMVGRLDESLRGDIEAAIVGIVQGESDVVVEMITRRGETPADLELDELRLDVEEFLEEYTQQSLADFDLAGCLKGIVEIVRRHRIILPAKIAMLLKVLIMLEGTAQQLSPRFNLAELIEPYARRSFQEKYSPQRVMQKLSSRYRDWDRLVEILPRDAADILHRMKKGSFDVHLNHRRLETTVNRLVLGILTAALFMGSTSLLSQSVRPLTWGISIPGAVGAGVAIWLGYTLYRAIKRMGDIQQK